MQPISLPIQVHLSIQDTISTDLDTPFSEYEEPDIISPLTSPQHMQYSDIVHSSAFTPSYQLCGYLYIRTGSQALWNKKYFMLSNNFLLSAATSLSPKLDKKLYLTCDSCITKTSDVTFNLLLRHKKRFQFKSQSAKLCTKWVNAIQKASTLKIKDIYRFMYILGRSGMTKVVAAQHKITNEESAIKIVDKRMCDKRSLKTEIDILKKLDNEYIVHLYDVIETNKYLYIVMEKCEGGELFDKIVELNGDCSEYMCCLIMHQIARGVNYMHHHGIIHRDLKPENILCVDSIHSKTIEKIKIADFGISMIENKMNDICDPEIESDIDIDDDTNINCNCYCVNTICTISYTAPEIFANNKQYDHRVDYWSIGVILFILLCGYHPFLNENYDDQNIIQSIVNDELKFDDEDWEHISYETKDLVKGLLCKDCSKRKTCDDILKLVWKVANSSASFFKSQKNFKETVIKRKKK
eukprot:454319_1